MGWRGALRSIEAEARRAGREAERRRKAEQKATMVANAADAVAEWSEHLQALVSLHIEPVRQIDWEALRFAPEPEPPRHQQSNELHARERLDSFTPRFFDFLKGGSEKKRLIMTQAVQDARDMDAKEHKKKLSEHAKAMSDWCSDKELASRLLDGDVSAEKEVISEIAALGEEGLIGSRLVFKISEDFLHAVAFVHSDEVVPTFRRKQLQSGKLSETNMPVGQRQELYQDYVCSVALKVAGDLLSVLPRSEVYVTCATSMLDRSTGYLADTPILSVQFVRQTFEGLRLSTIDPSDSMANFNHEMNFRKTKGFSQIAPLKPLPDK